MRRTANTLFVGNLPNDMRRSEVEDLFEKFGPIVDIDLKMPSRPPGYCFVEFEDPLDAEDAIRYRDGYPFDGRKIRVEWARGGRGSSPPLRRDYASSSVHGGSHSNSNVRRSDYRVIVDGLPTRASWQDLKDHMRRAGDVCFVDVHHAGRDTYGIVEYTNYEDMKYAIYKLDDTEFKNPFGRGFIRVREDRRGRERFSPSPSGSRTRSRSRSPRSYSRSVSRSRSPYRRGRGSRSRSIDSRRRSLSWSPRRSRSRSISWSGGADKRVPSRSPSAGKAALTPSRD